jgi:hypothetical protein
LDSTLAEAPLAVKSMAAVVVVVAVAVVAVVVAVVVVPVVVSEARRFLLCLLDLREF